MKRNGFVFVPREPPKRVILYPAQDIASQQQQLNGFYTRPKTDLITNNYSDTIQQVNNNIRLSRQQPLSSPLNNSHESTEKLDNDGSVLNGSRHSTALTAGQKVQNPYYANPFFRPKIIPNPQSSTSTTTNFSTPSSDSSATAAANKGRQPIYPKIPSPFFFSNGRTQDSESTVITSLTQDDSRHWAHSTPFAPTTTNNDTLKSKGSSATDIVISLMDTSRASLNPGSAPTINLPTRSNNIKEDSIVTSQTFTTSEQLPSTPPSVLVDISSTASQNNQHWKKALVANFQRNYRNIPTAKLLYTKQPTIPVQSSNNDTIINQQQPERIIVLNGNDHEGTIQTNEQENNYIERSTSLQFPITNKTEEIIKPIETSNSDYVRRKSISIPPALLTAKPLTNIEQQRANITRVMIRRDFVKSTDSKPPIPTTANIRSSMTSQSANNVIRVATISESPNRTYPLQQQTIPLSQKSLLSFTSNNQQKLNGPITDGMNSLSLMKMNSSQIVTSNGGANDESRRTREETNNKANKRAASASAASNYE